MGIKAKSEEGLKRWNLCKAGLLSGFLSPRLSRPPPSAVRHCSDSLTTQVCAPGVIFPPPPSIPISKMGIKIEMVPKPKELPSNCAFIFCKGGV